jgi:hypothetical protein
MILRYHHFKRVVLLIKRALNSGPEVIGPLVVSWNANADLGLHQFTVSSSHRATGFEIVSCGIQNSPI